MSLHSDSIQTQNSYQESFLALKASAGSGKTFALTIRYISLLFCGASANQILAITFTKKATSEMYQRIKSALYELANLDIYPESSFFKVLQDEGLSAESIRKNAHRIYLEFLNSTTKILTIDAFLQSVLKKFCWYIGLCQDYKLLTSNKDAQDEILELFLGHLYRLDSRSNSSKNKYHPLCDLATFCQSLDIKPQSFISFVQRCYSDKIHFSQDFFKQFDYPNTQHLQPSIKALQDKILSTATALKALINAQPDASDRTKNLIKNENFKQLLGLGEYDTKLTWIEKDVEHNYWNKLFATNENLKNDFTQLLENLKNDCLHYFKLRDEMIFTQIASVLHLYDKAINQYIRKHQTLSFEDSTIKAYELLALGKDLGGIDPLFFYFRLDYQIKHILIDEFQDTSHIQYAICKPIIDEIYSGVGQSFGERSVFFVGDTKQSIYGFRGSESGLFEQISTNPQIQTRNLPHNYRSSGIVLDFINTYFQHIFESYIPQTLPKNSSKANQGFVKITTQSDPVNGVINFVQELLDSAISPSDIAILCFKNDDVLSINSALKEHFGEIDTTYEGTKGASKKSVRALKAALYFLALEQSNPAESYELDSNISSALDSHALDSCTLDSKILDSRALESKNTAQPKTPQINTQAQLQTQAQFYLYEFLKLCGFRVFDKTTKTPTNETPHDEIASDTATLQAQKQLLLQCYKPRPSECILAIMNTFEIVDKSAQMLLECAMSYQNLNDFLQDLESMELKTPKESANGIQIMTIHSSKGLEFEYVILCDRLNRNPSNAESIIFSESNTPFFRIKNREIFDEEFKNAKQYSKQKAQNEANNVLYVACTRGKQGVMIAATNKKTKEGKIQSAFASLLCLINPKFDPQSTQILLTHGAPHSKHPSTTYNKPLPKVLKQQYFGTQHIEIKNQDSPHFDPKNIQFGEALHLGLEYALGYKSQNQIISHILFYHFGLEKATNTHILKYIDTLKNEAFIKSLIQNKQILVELPLLSQNTLKRIDMLAFDHTNIVILDYKSGIQNKAQHIQQVQGYIQDIQTLYPHAKVEGYIVYVRDEILLQKVE